MRVKDFLPPIAKQFARRLWTESSDSRVIRSLVSLPARTPADCVLDGRQLTSDDGRALGIMYRSVFGSGALEFTCAHEAPRIIDCGANVGVTVLYWKALYPDSCVVALEPDPRLLSMLRANCHGLSGVEFVEAAAWVEDTYLQFNASGGVSGHLSSLSSGTSGQATIDVKAVRLRNLLHEKVDLLKLDIEGAEVDVLADCASHLESVDRLFVEYHAFVNKPQRIGEFFQILDDAGFVVHVHPEMPSPKPFVKRECMNSKHHRLNVFASRADMPEVRFPLNAATT